MVLQGAHVIKCHCTKEPIRGDGGPLDSVPNRDIAKFCERLTKSLAALLYKEIIVQFVKVMLDVIECG